MGKYVFTFLLFCAISIQAQSDTSWTPSGVAGVNLSQIALSNWTQGGEDALAFTIFGNFGLKYQSNPWTLTNNLKVAFGRTKLGDENFRTTDNELFLESVLSYDVNWDVKPFFSNTVRTVITNGFDYGDPVVKISAFFDPGYITQALGFIYDKPEGFSTRLGLALQETFTSKFTHYADDPETSEIEKFKLETGIESVTEGEINLDDNLLFTSKLRLFGRFDQMDVWDVRWDNTLTAKVNEYVNVNLNVLVIYEKFQSPKTQLKEALQLGLSYNIF